MKRFILTLTTIFICTIAYAHTINWYVGNTILETTTCDSGDSITPPTAPYKYGYHFVKWKLPYTPIEYLESTGTQYIDTDWYLPADKDNFEIIASFTDAGTQKNNYACISGVNLGGNGEKQYSLIQFNKLDLSKIAIHNNDSLQSITFTVNPSIKNTVVISYSKGTTTITHNDIVSQSFNSILDSWSSYTIYLFATNAFNSARQNAVIKLYQFTIKVNNILIRDFIPVLDKNGTPCMYDKVEKKFYYNAGTGQFVAGPVIGGE